MAVLLIFFFFISVLYAGMTALFSAYWKRCPVFCPSTGLHQVKLSVVIPFRNESYALPGCLRSIAGQRLPQSNFEVILSDDHSTDGSGEYAREYCRLHEGFRYCPPTPDRQGKKAALVKGIRMAKNELIVLTDADCIAGEHWLETITAFYVEDRPDMVVGLVELDAEGGWMAAFQELELLSLTGTAAGAAAMGRPLYCSSANLAFTRALFEEYPDPFRMDIASGDDTFFLHRVKRDRSKHIQLLKSRSSVVTTRGKLSPGDFLNQRMRWASKSIHYRDGDTLIAASVTLLFNLALLASLVLFFCFRSMWVFPSLLLIKTMADRNFMKDILVFFDRKGPPAAFLGYELLYMAYVFAIAASGWAFRFEWKGRKTTGKSSSPVRK